MRELEMSLGWFMVILEYKINFGWGLRGYVLSSFRV